MPDYPTATTMDLYTQNTQLGTTTPIASSIAKGCCSQQPSNTYVQHRTAGSHGRQRKRQRRLGPLHAHQGPPHQPIRRSDHGCVVTQILLLRLVSPRGGPHRQPKGRRHQPGVLLQASHSDVCNVCEGCCAGERAGGAGGGIPAGGVLGCQRGREVGVRGGDEGEDGLINHCKHNLVVVGVGWWWVYLRV